MLWSGNLLYHSLVLPELRLVGRELNVLLTFLLKNEIDVQYTIYIFMLRSDICHHFITFFIEFLLFMAPVSPVFYTVESMRLPCKFGKSLELGSTSIGSKPEPYPTKTESINRRIWGPAHLPDLCCIFYFQCLKRSHIISIIFVQKEPMFPPIIKRQLLLWALVVRG